MEPHGPILLGSMQTGTPAQPGTTPHLVRRLEFKEALYNYKPSPEARTVVQATPMVLLVGPSASGRNTIITELLKTGRYHFIVSDTTRPPRVNNGILERNGVEYWFISEDDMLEGIQQGEYLEAEIVFGQQVSGTSVRELRKTQQEGRIAITDIDVGGINAIMHTKPDTIALLLLPPSFEIWQQRLHQRGDMTLDEKRRRFETACRIFAACANDHRVTIIINDNLERAVQQVRRIAEDGAVDAAEQARGRAIAERLLIDTQTLLKRM
ncbi:MAG TPA: hypothetical protein VLE73_04365 [Candidatus Saccharimonadales bacterium]|nr:hypothetical protein [Candidatus Saccharimonadales bacterium]